MTMLAHNIKKKRKKKKKIHNTTHPHQMVWTLMPKVTRWHFAQLWEVGFSSKHSGSQDVLPASIRTKLTWIAVKLVCPRMVP